LQLEEPPIEMKKMDTLNVDTLNVIDIMSLTDEETDRIHQIDINQEIVIPKIEPSSLFDDDEDDEYDHDELDSEGNKKTNKLHRQRKSINQTRSKAELMLMETSLMMIDPPPFESPTSPPPALPLSPNIVTTFNIPSTLSLTLPLTSTTTTSSMEASTSEERRKHHHHHHKHRHHHSSLHKTQQDQQQQQQQQQQHKQQHRHSMAVGRTAPITDERGQPIKSSHHHQHHHQPETEIILSPNKLGQQ